MAHTKNEKRCAYYAVSQRESRSETFTRGAKVVEAQQFGAHAINRHQYARNKCNVAHHHLRFTVQTYTPCGNFSSLTYNEAWEALRCISQKVVQANNIGQCYITVIWVSE